MTKRWLSLVLVLTLMSSLFAGGALAAPAPKGMYPKITFKPVSATIYVNEAEAESTVQVGTFYVEGVKANAAVSALIKSDLIDTITGTGVGEFAVTNGALTVKFTAPATSGTPAVKLSMTFEAGAGTSTAFKDKYDVEDASVTGTKTDFATITLCPPIASLTLAASAETGGAVSNAPGKFTTVPGVKASAVTLTATAKDAKGNVLEDPKFVKVTWASSNEDVATVTSTGVVSTVGAGTANITATATSLRGEVKTASWRIIADEVPVTTVTVASLPASINEVEVNGLLQLIATTNGTSNTVTWRSGDTTRATVDANGVVKGVAVGITNIYATSANGKESAPYAVEVKAATAGTNDPVLSIDNAALAGPYDVVKELKILSQQENSSIYYILSDAVISSVTAEKVKADGQSYTGPIAIDKDGEYYVYAVAYVGNTPSSVVSGDFEVELTVTSVKLDKVGKVTINGQQELKVTATVLPAGVSADRIKADLTWAITDETPASIVTGKPSDDKLSNTLTPKADKGTFTLTAELDGVEAFCDFEIVTVDVASITASPASITVAQDEKVKLAGVVNPANASHQTFTYEYANTDGATGDNASLSILTATADGVDVTGLKPGKGVVTVIHPDGKRISVPVTVTAPSQVVAAPVFSKASGSVFTADTDVDFASATNGATVTYTTDGTDPRYSGTATDGTTFKVTLGTKEVTIKAYANSVSGKVDSAVVTATYFAPKSVKGVSLDLTKLTLEGTGAKKTLTATFDPNDASEQGLTWTSSNAEVVKIADATGLTADLESGKPGTATITVTTKDGNKTATCVVTVTEKKPVSILLAGSAPKVGETSPLKATFTPDTTTNQAVTWTSSDPTVATIDANGVVTGLKEGTTNVTATSVAKDSNGLNVNSNSLPLTIGAASGIVEAPVFTRTPSTGLDTAVAEEVTIKMTSPTVGATVYYTTDGTMPTAQSAVAPESGLKISTNTIFRAIAIKDGKSSVVTTKAYSFAIPVTSVKLNTNAATLKVGETLQLSTTVTPDNASDKTIAYNSPMPATATVSTTGLITAKATGTVTITATNAASTKYDTIVVTVVDATVTSVTLTPGAASLTVGDEVTLLATVAPAEAPQALIWTSSDTDVVAVTAGTGSASLEAKKAGTVTITATATGGVKGTATITVEAAPAILPDDPTVLPTFTPSVKTFEAVENGSFTKVVGKFDAGAGQTFEQIQYYYKVEVSSADPTLAGKHSFTVGKDGTVTLYVSDAGTYTRNFDYSWKLTKKLGLGNLDGDGRYITGNTLTIVNKPSAIDFNAVATPAIEMLESETKTITLGNIANYDVFVKTGVAVSASASIGSANIATDGTVTVTLTKPAQGEHDVVVTLSAKGCPDVKTAAFKVTVKEDPTPATKAIKVTSSTKPYETSYKKKPVYVLAIADGTVTFSVPGYTATGWKSNYTKLLSIDPNGVATLKKGGATRITVTATLSDGTKVTQLVVIRKIASEVKLQYKSGKKWVDFSESNPLTIGIGTKKKVLTRAIVVTPAGGKVFAPKWTFSDPAIAFRGSKGYINGSVVGESIVTYELYNGVKATGLVIVSASKTADLIDELDLDVIEELETEEIEEIVEVEDDQEIEDVEVIEEIEETEAE